MSTFNQIIRTALFVLLTIFGAIMAFIFMVSTAIAIGILYIVARISGRPFGVKAYWDQRRRPTTASKQSTAPRSRDVTDIEMREIP
ncbi:MULTISPECIES: hypothetical protein [Alcaligenes]|jgi:uncharacterized membrane protein|uniref:ABC transporter ATP-binding protein n=2 Tax=Alcaligenes TaxID=507 RepID=A0AB33CYP4_ALCFA|nr:MULTISPECIES: hypothetical protein [Alcaligenes]ASR88429.1 hypothetical protein AFA_02555 [Alcaligenes faecalis]AYR21396.1 hypothetical protein D6I95_14130 [Alcaligenes faecalis]MCH4223439.1 hypothetical protein [Alcaligenes faecalis]QXR36532.1 hypothetical protein EGK70_003035 [Alcaligenes aquatilis]UQN36525.1 hypothetical protein MTR80_02025 [Alcaligenes aquatilis]